MIPKRELSRTKSRKNYARNHAAYLSARNPKERRSKRTGRLGLRRAQHERYRQQRIRQRNNARYQGAAVSKLPWVSGDRHSLNDAALTTACFHNSATSFRRFSRICVGTALSAKPTWTLRCVRFASLYSTPMSIFKSQRNSLLA